MSETLNEELNVETEELNETASQPEDIADESAVKQEEPTAEVDGKKVEVTLEKEEPKTEVSTETEQLAKLNKELTEQKNKYYRALADYQNLQRRTAKEQLEARGRGAEDFVKKMLPVLDTLDKAMELLTKTNLDKKILDGLEMFSIQFTDVLEKEGLKPINALGSKFDPNFHEAVNKMSNPNSEDEIVLDEYEKGYIFKERVLRTSKVVINQL